MNDHILANVKAYVALIGAIATGLQGVYTADTPVGQVLLVVTIVSTAFATWRLPNSEPVNGRHEAA